MLLAESLVVGTVGNVSVRLGDAILITPSRVPYQEMEASDLVLVNLEGEALFEASAPPSTELPLHLAVYRRRPDLRALVHTHSVAATAWSYLSETLVPMTAENVYHGVGEVRTSPGGEPGAAATGECAAAALGDSAAVLLACHGVLAGAGSPAAALDVARVVEHQARVAWILRDRGAGSAPGCFSIGERS
jgi:L-fuculose-phosphate aldolase